MLEKTFNPSDVEQHLYDQWEESGAFKPDMAAPGEPFSIVIPPPNVTGSLHMGHALNNSLQDVLARYWRMKGRKVLWQPGTDHAGIATQMVVERNLQSQGGPGRRDLGREKFVDLVWEWKAESGGAITRQLRRLGASCDWSRERFTMDDGLSAAVRKVFVELHKDGLIYKDKRLVNWDPKFQTAISDLEVESKEVKGHLWHFRYPLTDDPERHIIVATTRPETMLGDTGVAVHPDDERYKDLIGKTVTLPLVGREIPIVADSYADPEQGTGAVKITPAHDFNDFEVGKRCGLEAINILDDHAQLNDEVPEAYRGLDRFEARDKVVADLDALGLLAEIEDHTHMVPYGDRSNAVIEPWLTDQWYVDAPTLAKPAIEAVEDGSVRFVPKNWEKTYFEWMRNIQPWCISRQLWWGHRIPAWYGPDGEVFVEHTKEEAQAAADAHYGKPVELVQDEDVLDTWFSSGLWPFSTLGWPEETEALKTFYPTSTLVTGFDIIFFWVARMMMLGLHFQKEIPFHDIYVHALVRDENGQKMSKSKGNVVDPLELIGSYGADALRFTLIAMAAQGRDVKLSTSRVEGYRNFGTKLWNAARFCEMNDCVAQDDFDPAALTLPVNKWIVGEVKATLDRIGPAIEGYKFDEAARATYEFIWGVFCDWYLEFIKPALNGDDEVAKAETRATAGWVLDQALIMAHPMMPFITEELWQHFGKAGAPRDGMLIGANWPEVTVSEDQAAKEQLDIAIRLVTEVRSLRSEMNVPAGAKIPLLVKDANETATAAFEAQWEPISRLARLETVEMVNDVPEGAVQTVLDGATLILPLKDVIDVDQERARLTKEIGKLDKEIAKFDGKLNNEKFLAKAPDHVVEEQRTRKAEAETTRAKLNDALKRLSAAA